MDKFPTTWEIVTSKDFLLNVFLQSVSRGSAAGRDGVTPAMFSGRAEEEIATSIRKLESGSYRFTAYGQLLQSKGAGKRPREISLPTVRDRVVLRAMAESLRWMYPAASIPLAQDIVGRVIRALSVSDHSHFVRLDIKEFYPSIVHSSVRSSLESIVDDERLIDLFMKAISTPTLSRGDRFTDQSQTKGIPQGLAVSNGLAELVLETVDAVPPEGKCAYFRYVDDILILGSEPQIRQFAAAVRKAIADLGLETHSETSSKGGAGPIGDGFEYLGYRFEWPRVTVRKPSTQRIEGSIARVFTRYKYEALRAKGPAARARQEQRLKWHIDLLVAGCIFEERRRGWLAYYSQIRHHQLLHHLDALVARQRERHGVTHLTFKSFVDSYRFAASRREDESGFVLNFDSMADSDVRDTLRDIFGVKELERLTPLEVRQMFADRIRVVTASLERDVASDY